MRILMTLIKSILDCNTKLTERSNNMKYICDHFKDVEAVRWTGGNTEEMASKTTEEKAGDAE